MRYALLLLAALLMSCGASSQGWHYEDVTVEWTEHAEPWPDLPEALKNMLAAMPEETRDVAIFLVPPYEVVMEPGTICAFYVPSSIYARITGELTADGCLPHELAHRVRWEEAQDLRHNDEWKAWEMKLREAAK